jgi:hypothetical protein
VDEVLISAFVFFCVGVKEPTIGKKDCFRGIGVFEDIGLFWGIPWF